MQVRCAIDSPNEQLFAFRVRYFDNTRLGRRGTEIRSWLIRNPITNISQTATANFSQSIRSYARVTRKVYDFYSSKNPDFRYDS